MRGYLNGVRKCKIIEPQSPYGRAPHPLPFHSCFYNIQVSLPFRICRVQKLAVRDVCSIVPKCQTMIYVVTRVTDMYHV